jgi:hypothetical protein
MRDFIVSPGFAGLAALLAVIIAACAVLYGVRRAGKRSQQLLEQREHEHAEARADAERTQAIARCWARWQWVVDTAAIEPAVSEGATLGLGPAVTLELLRGLLRDAEELGDDTLAKAVAIYQEQLLLVLAQQGGPVADLPAPTVKLPVVKPDPTSTPPPPPPPSTSAHRKPDTPPPPAVAEKPSAPAVEAPPAAAQESGGGRRRR